MYHKSEKEQCLITYGEKGLAEDFEEVTEIIKITKRHFKKGAFYMQTFVLDAFVLENKYTFLQMRTLLALKLRIDYNNRIKSFTQEDLAEEVGTSRPRICRALKRIKADGIIEYIGRDWYFSDKFIKYAGEKPKKKAIN